jgi:hypothetical protein
VELVDELGDHPQSRPRRLGEHRRLRRLHQPSHHSRVWSRYLPGSFGALLTFAVGSSSVCGSSLLRRRRLARRLGAGARQRALASHR